MKNIRITAAIGPFVRGSRGLLLHEDEKSVWMKGQYLVGPECLTKNLNGTVGPGDVVYGPIPKEFIEEYVPEPTPLTVDEKIQAIWPPKK